MCLGAGGASAVNNEFVLIASALAAPRLYKCVCVCVCVCERESSSLIYKLLSVRGDSFISYYTTICVSGHLLLSYYTQLLLRLHIKFMFTSSYVSELFYCFFMFFLVWMYLKNTYT